MAKNNKADMSCARVKKYTASDVSKAERHNERKNETYENMNVIEERIPYNVHFKKPFAPTYMEQLKQMEADGMVSLRGVRKDATLFNEIVIDVNTMYFERNGGYEYAKQFYEETYHFIEEKFGAGIAHLRPCFTPMFQRFGTAPVGSGNGVENKLSVLVSDTVAVLVQFVHPALL